LSTTKSFEIEQRGLAEATLSNIFTVQFSFPSFAMYAESATITDSNATTKKGKLLDLCITVICIKIHKNEPKCMFGVRMCKLDSVILGNTQVPLWLEIRHKKSLQILT
jgi:hypothetical protein